MRRTGMCDSVHVTDGPCVLAPLPGAHQRLPDGRRCHQGSEGNTWVDSPEDYREWLDSQLPGHLVP